MHSFSISAHAQLVTIIFLSSMDTGHAQKQVWSCNLACKIHTREIDTHTIPRLLQVLLQENNFPLCMFLQFCVLVKNRCHLCNAYPSPTYPTVTVLSFCSCLVYLCVSVLSPPDASHHLPCMHSCFPPFIRQSMHPYCLCPISRVRVCLRASFTSECEAAITAGCYWSVRVPVHWTHWCR